MASNIEEQQHLLEGLVVVDFALDEVRAFTAGLDAKGVQLDGKKIAEAFDHLRCKWLGLETAIRKIMSQQ
jgi:hypothetical protein